MIVQSRAQHGRGICTKEFVYGHTCQTEQKNDKKSSISLLRRLSEKRVK
jgi:hypothetical protein